MDPNTSRNFAAGIAMSILIAFAMGLFLGFLLSN